MHGSNASRAPSRHRMLGICAAIAVALAGCVGPYYQPGPRAQIGAFTGAAAGGLIGAAAGGGGEGIVAGLLLGGLLGGAVGDSLDRADRRYASHNFQRGLEYEPSGRTAYWNNPDSGHRGSLTPTGTFGSVTGYCRDYRQTVTIEGQTRPAYGTACRDEDGIWRVDP